MWGSLAWLRGSIQFHPFPISWSHNEIISQSCRPGNSWSLTKPRSLPCLESQFFLRGSFQVYVTQMVEAALEQLHYCLWNLNVPFHFFCHLMVSSSADSAIHDFLLHKELVPLRFSSMAVCSGRAVLRGTLGIHILTLLLANQQAVWMLQDNIYKRH
jgi:hypothetical protein